MLEFFFLLLRYLVFSLTELTKRKQSVFGKKLWPKKHLQLRVLKILVMNWKMCIYRNANTSLISIDQNCADFSDLCGILRV